MNSFLKINKDTLLTLSVIFVMSLAFVTRSINLNYNSAFNDEAIYIIVGLLGFFERDWWTYNASNWIPGVQYLYPSFSAIFYNIGGLVASRFINVVLSIFLIESVFIMTGIIYNIKNSQKSILTTASVVSPFAILAGFIAATIIAGSDIAYYVSRLATYDMPSFTFLFLGLLLLIHSTPVNSGKRYFGASLLLSLSYLTKIITGIYMPLIILYFGVYTYRMNKKTHTFFKQYFFAPTIVIFILFAAISHSALLTYFTSQNELPKASIYEITKMIWNNTGLVWGFWFIGTIGLFLKKQFNLWAILTLSALWIIVFHISNSRVLSLDKHTLLLISFLSIVAGLGISSLVQQIKLNSLKILSVSLILLSLSWYWYLNSLNLNTYNHLWKDTTEVEQVLNSNVNSGDQILVESGSAMILATYYKNYPTNTTTFDWFEYRKYRGEDAYKNAVRDGYFELIQLESDQNNKSNNNSKLSKLVKDNMETNYNLIYNEDGFLVYRRAF